MIASTPDFPRYENQLPLRDRLLRGLWLLVYYLLFRYSPRVGFNCWRLFLLRCFGASVTAESKIYPSAKVWAPWNLTMGRRACLADGVDCYCVGKITIGCNVTISQRAFLCTASHDVTLLDKPLIVRDITIQDHVWVCAEAFVGPGVTLKEGVVVAARAVVTRDVVAWNIVGGNPAKILKERVIE